MNEINVIRRELRALGITRRCRCYGRIVMAIQLAVDQEDSLEAVTKEIYWEVGSRCGRKWTAVERNIRTAVQIAWRTNPELLREMAGYPWTGRPPHRNFWRSCPTMCSGRWREERRECLQLPEYDRKRGRKPARALHRREKNGIMEGILVKRGGHPCILLIFISTPGSPGPPAGTATCPTWTGGPGAKASS